MLKRTSDASVAEGTGLTLAALAALAFLPAAAGAQTTVTINVSDYGGDAVLSGVGITQREYLLDDNTNYCKAGQNPLIVMILHGASGSPTAIRNSFDIYSRFPRRCAVWAYPAGSGRDLAPDPDFYTATDCESTSPNPACSWNANSDTRQGWAESNSGTPWVSDDDFLNYVANSLLSTYWPGGKVYIGGLSKGGAMAWHMICNFTTFAGVFTVSSTINQTSCTATGHPPAFHLHGLADTAIDWSTPSSPWLAPKTEIREKYYASGSNNRLILHSTMDHGYPTTGEYDYARNVIRWLERRKDGL